MLTGKAKEEMRNMLKLSKEKDLRSIESKIVGGNFERQSTAERIEAILSCASQPSHVLRQKRLRKTVMLQYLWNRQADVSQDQYKRDYIRELLAMWQVKDDEYLVSTSYLHCAFSFFQYLLHSLYWKFVLPVCQLKLKSRVFKMSVHHIIQFMATVYFLSLVGFCNVGLVSQRFQDDIRKKKTEISEKMFITI